MNLETAVLLRLSNSAAIADIVGDKIYWDLRNQGDPYPAIVLTLISDPIPQDLNGNINFRPSRVQVDCYATDQPTNEVLKKAVIAALTPSAIVDDVQFQRAFILNQTGGGKDVKPMFVFRKKIDFQIWHNAEI